MSEYIQQVQKRRTFAIISHPDAGKTTLTEKFLLYGGAIQQAGTVKGKKNSKHATSDWMEIEKQRGISVTSSVLQFDYNDFCINILDTPGHQDFSEDTYRTLMAADCAVMVIDASKGVEEQTRKLFKVCTMRQIPIFTFVNKMDREAKDPYSLMEEIEQELGIETCAVNWPIGSGKEFKGVYERNDQSVIRFIPVDGGKREVETKVMDGHDPLLQEELAQDLYNKLQEDIELLDIAGNDFDLERVRQGKLSPVCFGSALTNFGIEPFLRHFLEMTTSPLPRLAGEKLVDPLNEDFSAFVFKIQANMNKSHRDRMAFMRICSGKFTKGMEVYHFQGAKKIKLNQSKQLMADERQEVEEAFAGDIIGVFDSGIFSIGDTITTGKERFAFDGIPTFAPEHFALIRNKDTMKRKQFVKGVEQIAKEGAIQIFTDIGGGMEEIIVGVVGVLQFEVLEHRLANEYNVEIIRSGLPYQYIRWMNQDVDVKKLNLSSDTKQVQDLKGQPLLLFTNDWGVRWATDKNPELKLASFSK
ncbi:peptide chain release factor 3 [Tannockella kyphosi]|uniref:peptide chain release factor 3 n=1 Tax=Tannockella kyphosi TaxID=2899121 RepID=UPI00201151D7|nr:peptide chain release factor 3 [Tannockella kyphosi]